MLCPNLKAQPTASPLSLDPIEADSIYLMDFFWDAMQKKAIANDATPVKHSWTVKKISATKVAKLEAKWNKIAANLTITGSPKGKADNMTKAIKDFNTAWQLSQLTAKAQYIDLAERILVNRIMPLWLANPSAKGSKEANDIFRTIDQMAYSVRGKDVYINMFMRSNAHMQNSNINIYLQASNSSPWYYDTSLNFVDNMDIIQQMDETKFNDYKRVFHYAETQLDSSEVVFHIRIPSWLTGNDMLPGYKNLGKRERIQIIAKGNVCMPEIKDGYAILSDKWGVRDLINIRIPSPILRLQDERSPNSVALQRGPIVYAFEDLQPGATFNPSTPIDHEFSDNHQAIILTGEVSANGQSTPYHALPYYISKASATIFAPTK